MKYKLTPRSKESIDYVLSNVDVYHISDFSYHAASQDVIPGREDIKETLRSRWLYDENGLYSSINRYNSFAGRIFEFAQHGDYIRSLRQRINIMHILFECNFDSNLPTHISVAPKYPTVKDLILDVESKADYSDVSFIIHPGQTRAQGSVFAQSNLKNVILYVNKCYKEQIKVKEGISVQKIQTVDELLKHYRPVEYTPELEYEYDFYTPGTSLEFKNGVKHHIAHNYTPILKCNTITSTSSPLQHPGSFYLQDSFWGMDSFCKTLYNSKLNLYTDNKAKTSINVEQNRQHIRIGNQNPILTSPPGKINSEHQGIARLLYNKEYLPKTDEVESKLSFIESFSSVVKESKQTLENTDPHTPINLVPTYLEIPIDTPYEKIAELNGYKGFCFYISSNASSNFNRDIYELLFCIHSSVSITKTAKGDIAIINCEHPYWKTKTDFKQWVLPDSFRE